jgi:hypothetical protein
VELEFGVEYRRKDARKEYVWEVEMERYSVLNGPGRKEREIGICDRFGLGIGEITWEPHQKSLV